MKARLPRHQAGLSIIELMIALLLGLLLMGGVMQVFLSSRQTYQTNSALSQVQEAGRFALDFLAYDLKNAGYGGECISARPVDRTPATLPKNDLRYELGSGIEGWNGTDETNVPSWLNTLYIDPAKHSTGTDLILLKHAAGATGIELANPVDNGATILTATAATGQPPGSLLVISDAAGCTLFVNQNASTDTTLSTPITMNRAYPRTAIVSSYQSTLYYIGPSNISADIPALRRIRYLSSSTFAALEVDEELVTGIQDLQIQYAQGDATGQITGDYHDAQLITDWSSVISAQISLIAVSRDTRAVVPNQQFTFRGNNVTLANGRLGQVFTQTVSIRNHLP
ncbi:PilW family protein [Pseudomonas oryzihabitans]|uniref:PilW family protein n=1 Tax=Pseudomonas oryzihabitans TaxID=47885 RepID=UPI002893DD07|nr:PilW family protein [Pseudomonas oryzihabitans]MDT3718950.1 PilW family protein [Pseudomonas oryzihabitans]